jgi:hypothetical protein
LQADASPASHDEQPDDGYRLSVINKGSVGVEGVGLVDWAESHSQSPTSACYVDNETALSESCPRYHQCSPDGDWRSGFGQVEQLGQSPMHDDLVVGVARIWRPDLELVDQAA